MKITKIQVVNRQLIISNKIIYTGKNNVDNFKFSFDDEWLNLNKTLVIIVDSNTYHVPLLNDEAILPTEIYSRNSTVSIGVFGKIDDIILASELKKISIHEGAYKEGQAPGNLPTPTQWDLYVEEINNLLNESKANVEACNKVLLEVEKLKNETQIIKEEVEKAELNIETYNKNHVEKLEEYNENAVEKTSTFDKNVQEKVSGFNSNATNKTTAFDENVVEKTNDFDTHIAEKMKEFEEFSDGITVITSGTDDLIEGESELPARSMYLVYETDEDEVNQDV